MSVVDNLVDKGSEMIEKCLKTCVNLVGVLVKGVGIGVTLGVRAVYSISKTFIEGINTLIKEHRLTKADKERKECQRALEFKRLSEFNVRSANQVIKKQTESKMDVLSPQEIVEVLNTFREIANNFEVEQRKIVFPDGLLNELYELLKINPLDIETEEELNALRQKVALFIQRSNAITELSNAVIFAVRNEKYVPNHLFTLNEIKESSAELLTLFKDFERALGCKNQLANNVNEVEVLKRITTTEKSKVANEITKKGNVKV